MNGLVILVICLWTLSLIGSITMLTCGVPPQNSMYKSDKDMQYYETINMCWNAFTVVSWIVIIVACVYLYRAKIPKKMK